MTGFQKLLRELKVLEGLGSKIHTTKSAGNWNFPHYKTSSAIPISLVIERSASSNVMQVGDQKSDTGSPRHERKASGHRVLCHLGLMITAFRSLDTMRHANNGIAPKTIQPPVVLILSRNPNPRAQDLSFEISFTDALMLMPKFASTLKTLIGNKEKLSELQNSVESELFSWSSSNKRYQRYLEDPGRISDSIEFTGITTCNALADLGCEH
ncbi:hypothetical protein Tco_1530538 [Tanacetum coccineum]